MNIHLHIERLVLDGLPLSAADGPRVQAALDVELSRLLAQSGLSPGLHAGGAIPSLSGGTIQVGKESGPPEFGRQIAGAISGKISESFDRTGPAQVLPLPKHS